MASDKEGFRVTSVDGNMIGQFLVDGEWLTEEQVVKRTIERESASPPEGLTKELFASILSAVVLAPGQEHRWNMAKVIDIASVLRTAAPRIRIGRIMGYFRDRPTPAHQRWLTVPASIRRDISNLLIEIRDCASDALHINRAIELLDEDP